MTRKYINKGLIIGLLIIVFGCEKTIEDEGSFEEKEEQLIHEVLMEREDMQKTIQASKKLYIWELLKTFGTYTFFAPTDDAWDNYLQRKGIASIEEIENETLEAIFEYHILPVEKLTLVLENGMMDEADSTINGDLLYMDLTKGLNNIIVNNKAKITNGNLEAWNGVVHVVDNVLDPPVMNVSEYLASEDKYNRFYQFLNTNGAIDTLSILKTSIYPFEKTEYTVMAIPNAHMDRVEEVIDSLKEVDAKYDEYVAQDPAYAKKYMPNQAKQYAMSFIISGTEYTPNMYSGYKPTLGKVPYGDNTVRMKVKVSDEGIKVNDQASLLIENSNLIMKNGVIHECDAPFVFLEKSPRNIIRSASTKERWNTRGKGRVQDISTVNGYMGDDLVGEVELIPNGAGDRFWIDVPDVPAGFYSLTLITKKQGSLSKIYANDQLMIFPTTNENGVFDFSFLLGNRGRVDNRDPNPCSRSGLFLYEMPMGSFEVKEGGKVSVTIEVVQRSNESPNYRLSAIILEPAVL